MAIRAAVIPSMNSSWARTQAEKAKDGEMGRERQRVGDRERATGWVGGRRGEGGGAFDARTPELFSTVCGPRFRADVLTVSGSMEGEIPTKGGVQILWEIRPLFNIS